MSSIDLKKYPGSMAAIAKILNHMGASWTFRTDGFDADNVSLTAGDRAGQRKITLGHCPGGHRLWRQDRADAGMWPFFHRNALGSGERLRRRSAVPGAANHRTAGGGPGGRAYPREPGAAKRATYHDACQLSRRGGATAAPRAILQALGVELHELEDAGDANWCCGGGGGVALIKRAQPLRDKAFEIKQRQVEATGVQTVYTSCSGCRQTLEHGGKATNWNKTVASLLELVADNLKD